MKAPLDPEFLDFARRLRKNQTDAEKLLWKILRNRQLLGLKFRRQRPVGPYILDFYCHDCKLCVELDGGQHYTGEAQQEDEDRAAFLATRGVRTLRFSNLDVLQNIEGVLLKIAQETTPLTPTLSQRGRGNREN
jgi:very-short-patch-repair endonuclease